MLEPLVRAIIKKFRIKRIYSSVIVCTLFTLILSGLSYFLVTVVTNEAIDLSKYLLKFTKNGFASTNWAGTNYISFLHNLPPEYNATIQQLSSSLLDSLQTILVGTASALFNLATKIPNILLQGLFFFLALFLISINLSKMKKDFLHFFDIQDRSKIESVLIVLQKAVFGFLRAQFIISSMIFLVVLIGFLIMGISYPSVLALLITLVDLLPIFGTGFVMIPMSFYYLLIGKIPLFWGLLIHYTLITVFRKIIEPKVLSDSIGISALATLFSMYIGFQLTGVIGLFMGPFVVILYQSLFKAGLLKINIKF